MFKENFLGKSRFAQKCKILNPEVLMIRFDQAEDVLEVQARGLLQIENPELGYRINYLLTHFTYHTTDRYISYSGYPSYEPLTGTRAKSRRWEKNRKKAYMGSVMHFVRALRARQLEEEGFQLHRLYRQPNPQRPAKEVIQAARTALQKRGSKSLPADDSVAIILAKAELPEVIEKLDTAKLSYNDYLLTKEDNVLLSFEGHFQVVYTGEKAEKSYIHATKPVGFRRPAYQVSIISLLKKPVLLEESGRITQPMDAFFEGYWSWEKVGDMLPMDYKTTAR